MRTVAARTFDVRRYCVITLVSAITLLAVSADAAPAVRFESRTIVVDQLPHGTTVAWFGIAHEPQAYHLRVREYAGMERDDDRDGTVRIALPRDIVVDSAWVVVDTTTGQWLVAQPSGATVRKKPLPPPVFKRGSGAATVVNRYPYLKFWLVRPHRGAWVHTAQDGGPGDDDGHADGAATARLTDFVPVAGSPAAPVDLQRGDLVIVVDPWQLRISETSIRDEDLEP